MTDREPRMKGFAWLTPYLTVRDPEAMLEFYQRAFGFKRGNTMPGPEGKIGHAEMTHQGETIIMFGPEGAMGGTCKSPATSGVEVPVTLYVYCPDVDALYSAASEIPRSFQSIHDPS